MASTFSLNGRVVIDGGSAIATLKTLAERTDVYAKNTRTASATLKANADIMLVAARAAESEARMLGTLNLAQEKANAVNRESLATRRAIAQAASDKSSLNTVREEVVINDSLNKQLSLEAVTLERINTERARGAAIVQGAAGKADIAAGQEQLLLSRSLTETTKQQIALDDSEGRAAVREQQIASAGIRDRIAVQKLALSAQRDAAAQAASAARAAESGTRSIESGIRGLGTASLHVGEITGVLFLGLAANAIEMQAQFAKVIRTSDILDIQGKNATDTLHKQAVASAALRLQFDALAQSLPISYKALTEIGAAANQLGVPTAHVAAFTEVVAKFSATTGVTVDATATALGRLDSLIPDVNHNYLGLADAINEVGVKSVATDQQIIGVTSQIAGIAAASGLGYKTVIGFAGALASVAVSPYLARGLSTRLFSDINNAASQGGDALTKFANVSGVSAATFKSDWETGGQAGKQAALVALLDGIRKSGSNAVNVLKDLGIKSAQDVPALLKLANAADATGKAGALLTQTFHDANNAAGANARQYAVIADTIQARLQVALNNVQILFRNIGETNLGPLSVLINGISDSVLKLSQGLDRPFKLLGTFQLPFTNGDLLSFGSLAVGAVAGFTLLVAVLSKVYTSFAEAGKGIAAVRALLGSGAVASTEYAAAAGEVTAATTAEAAAMRELAIAQGGSRIAGLSAGAIGAISPLIRSTPGLVPTGTRITAATSAFGDASNLQMAAYGAKNAIKQSDNALVAGVRDFSTKAASAVGTGFAKVGATAKDVGGAISSTLLGPVGIGVGVVVAGLVAADDAMRKIGSSAGDVSVNILKASSSADILKTTFVSSASDGVAALFDPNSTQKFLTNVKQLKISADSLGTGGVLSDFAAKFTSTFSEDALNKGFNYTTDGLDKIDSGFKNLADGGNLAGAVTGIQNFLKPLNDQERTNVLAHMSSATEILTTALNKSGKSAGANGENILKLTHNNQQLTKELSAADIAAQAHANAFKQLGADGQDYITVTSKAAAASLDLTSAFTAAAGKSGTATLADFYKQADAQLTTFEDQTKNIATLTGVFGSGYTKELSGLPPALLAEVVKAGPKAEAKLKEYMDRATNFNKFRQNFSKIIDDPALAAAFASLGTKMQDQIKTSLEQGHSIEDAFRAAGPKAIAAFNSTLSGAKLKAAVYLELHPGSVNADLAYLTRDRIVKISAAVTAAGGNGAQVGRNVYQLGGAAAGGPITGPGTGTSDSIPTMLSNGEYVIRAAQVEKNRKLLDAINAGTPTGHFANGGYVTGSANYNDTQGARMAPGVRVQQAIAGMTELSPYDRHLLQTIADNIGVTIAPDYIAGAGATVARAQSRRGNG